MPEIETIVSKSGRTFIRNPPELRQEEDLRLISQANKSGKPQEEAIDALIEKYVAFQHEFAAELAKSTLLDNYSKSTGVRKGEVIDKLKQEIRIGIWKAAPKYSAEEGTLVSTFLYGAAKLAYMTIKETISRRRHETSTLYDPLGESDEPKINLIEYKTEEAHTETIATALDKGVIGEIVDNLLGKCTPIEASVLRARFGIGEKAKSLRETADIFKVSRERIRQIEEVAKGRLGPYAANQKLAERLGIEAVNMKVFPETPFNGWQTFDANNLTTYMIIAQLTWPEREAVLSQLDGKHSNLETLAGNLLPWEIKQILKKIRDAEQAYKSKIGLDGTAKSPDILSALSNPPKGLNPEYVKRAFLIHKFGNPGINSKFSNLSSNQILKVLGEQLYRKIATIEKIADLFYEDMPLNLLSESSINRISPSAVLEYVGRVLFTFSKYGLTGEDIKYTSRITTKLGIAKRHIVPLNELYQKEHLGLSGVEERLFELLKSATGNDTTIMGGKYYNHKDLAKDHLLQIEAIARSCKFPPLQEKVYKEWLNSGLTRKDFTEQKYAKGDYRKETLNRLTRVINLVSAQLTKTHIDDAVENSHNIDMGLLPYLPLSLDSLFPLRVLAYLNKVYDKPYKLSEVGSIFTEEAVKSAFGSLHILEIFGRKLPKMVEYAGLAPSHAFFIREDCGDSHNTQLALDIIDYTLDQYDAIILIRRSTEWKNGQNVHYARKYLESYQKAREAYWHNLNLTENQIFARYLFAIALKNDRADLDGFEGLRLKEEFIDSIAENKCRLYAACNSNDPRECLTDEDIEYLEGKIRNFMTKEKIIAEGLHDIAYKLRHGIHHIINPQKDLEPAKKNQQYKGIRKIDKNGKAESFEEAVYRIMINPVKERKQNMDKWGITPYEPVYYQILNLPELRFRRLKSKINYARQMYLADDQSEHNISLSTDRLEKAKSLHKSGDKVYAFISRMSHFGIPVSAESVIKLHSYYYGADTVPKCIDALQENRLIRPVNPQQKNPSRRMYVSVN